MPRNATNPLLRPFDVKPDAREAWQLSAALWVGAALFISVGSIFAGHIRSFGEYLSILTGLASAVTIAYGLYGIFKLVAGRPRWIAYLAISVSIPIASLLQLAIEYGLYFALASVFESVVVPDHDLNSLLVLGVVYFCLYCSNVMLLWVTSASRAAQAHAERLAQTRADLLQAELDALRLKLNPHFMFNALSSAIALIQADKAQDSARMLYRLSDLLQTSFDIGGGDISLDEELAIVADYVAVEQVRFPDRLRFETRADPHLGAVPVPSFLLQPLVENAVKHAVASSLSAVLVRVEVNRGTDALIIVVENEGADGAGSPIDGGSGVGHRATRQRLALRYGPRATFKAFATANGYKVELSVPFEA